MRDVIGGLRERQMDRQTDIVIFLLNKCKEMCDLVSCVDEKLCPEILVDTTS